MKKVPRKIGFGEGGNRVPKLEELLENLVDELIDVYGEVDGLNPVKRRIWKYEEDYLQVEETSPEEGEEDVAVGVNIEVDFNQDIVDNSPAGDDIKDHITLKKDGGEGDAETINDATISEDTLTIEVDGNMDANEEYQLVIDKEKTVRAEGSGLGLEDDFVLNFTTAE